MPDFLYRVLDYKTVVILKLSKWMFVAVIMLKTLRYVDLYLQRTRGSRLNDSFSQWLHWSLLSRITQLSSQSTLWDHICDPTLQKTTKASYTSPIGQEKLKKPWFRLNPPRNYMTLLLTTALSIDQFKTDCNWNFFFADLFSVWV